MRSVPLAAAPLLLIAGCHPPERRADEGGNLHIAAGESRDGGVAVSIPGVDGRLALPAIDLSRHVGLGGIGLAPATAVHAIDVATASADGDGPRGTRLSFASARPPAALLGWYRRHATAAGYAVADVPGGLAATRGHSRFALTVRPAGGGSDGTILFREAR